jgi:hypothetical protein
MGMTLTVANRLLEHLSPSDIHLVADATDECRGCIDRVREWNLLPRRVVHEARPVIANQLPNRERYLQRVPAQTRLISAENDVAKLDDSQLVKAQSSKNEWLVRTARRTINSLPANPLRSLHLF